MEYANQQAKLNAQEQELRRLLRVPADFPLPRFPEFNPPSAEKILLGRHLFYDTRLSANQTQACASCHLQSLAFSDAQQRSLGSTGQLTLRNSQGLANAAYHASFTWANDGFANLEAQIHVPIRSDNPIELGVTDTYVAEVLARFDSDPHYQEMFAKAFPQSSDGASINKIVYALASFCRRLVSANSAFDQYRRGDKSALTEQQLRGFRLFNGERFECFHCHAGINFSASYQDSRSNPEDIRFQFFNNGLYNLDGEGSYPAADQGLYDLTLNPQHRGLFRPQSLRNIALTAPYMHDGSIATLREVIEHYARGGRLIKSGPNRGDGRLNPLKSGLIQGFEASEEEIAAVLAFLHALTDNQLIQDPELSNPFLAPTIPSNRPPPRKPLATAPSAQ